MLARHIIEAIDEQDVLDRRERGEHRREPSTIRQRPARPHLDGGHEHERALSDPRVRKRQRVSVAHLVTEHQQVDVDRARTPPLLDTAIPSEERLELQELREQGLRGEARAAAHDEVEVGILRHVPWVIRRRPRWGLVDGGDLIDGDPFELRDQLDRRCEGRPSITDVRSEPEQQRATLVPGIGVCGHRSRRSVTTTSSRGTGTGACGLCTDTVAACTRASARQTSTRRVASRSIRS